MPAIKVCPECGDAHWHDRDCPTCAKLATPALDSSLAPSENDGPFGAPRPPFRIDADGDIVDADGWVVCVPAREVWRVGDAQHALDLCRMLNAGWHQLNEPK